MSAGRLGCAKLICSAGTRLCLMSGYGGGTSSAEASLPVRLRIIPKQPLLPSPPFVAICIYDDGRWSDHYSLANNETDSEIEVYLAGNSGERGAPSNKGHRGITHYGKLFGECVDEQLIVVRSSEQVNHRGTWINPFRLGESRCSR